MSKFIPNRVFEDYDPPTDLVTEEGCDTLLIYLPGFKKEQLKVQLTISRVLKISGERPIGDNRYRRFQKEFRIPPNCDTKEITAKFEGGILYIRQPKVITPAPTPAQQPQKPPTEAPRPQQPPPPQPQVSVPPALPLPQPQSQQRTPPPPPSPPQLQSQQHAPLPPSPPQPQSQQHAPLPPSPPQPQSQKHAPPTPPPPQKYSSRTLPTLPPSPPKLQPQQEAAVKGRQEETRAEKKDKEAMDSKDEASRDKSEVIQLPRQVVNSGLFRELRKPDNLKRLGVSVLLVLIIAFYISYMFKSFVGNEQEIMSEYYPEL